MSIHRITDLALKAAPDMEPGILFTERQFGLLELHANKMADLDSAGQAILKGIKAKARINWRLKYSTMTLLRICLTSTPSF